MLKSIINTNGKALALGAAAVTGLFLFQDQAMAIIGAEGQAADALATTDTTFTTETAPLRQIYEYLVGLLEGYGAAIVTLITTILGCVMAARGGSPLWILGGLFTGILLSFLPEFIIFVVDTDPRAFLELTLE